ncbi:histidinol-phosphatase HisJ family protein [Paenibacillus thermoaerophilus]|uniref:Histidinol-phosphatase n=1 Tax=Paenibacillus thermoaerophilus TaxID=1215385 RepID=A0ABW2V455_9BACL|nr:histidinol-phosphatase HisJ family protein [Paenibacillus thermoaerophilus]TMV11034.1 histidinol-phosphatase HisJ family protein [Paenibacillus thermoaerophilus]
MYDYHVHTSFSADSTMPMEKAVRAAIAAGVREIAFTEHLDYIYPNCDLTFEFDYEPYSREVDRLRAAYGQSIAIRKAVEIGLHPEASERNLRFTEGGRFDFIIGSAHIIDNLDLHNGDYFQGRSPAQALETYFEQVYRLVCEYTRFHVFGHLTLIKRYLHYANTSWTEVDWTAYGDWIDAILRQLIETGRGIEVNMSGHRYGLGISLPHLPILKRYRELGGEIVTIGSDAHIAEHIAHHFAEGHELLRAAGFTALTTFEAGKPVFVPIPD